ncbi:hypothetical protein SCH01S_39_00850 [Sphingomonas changbaiensis NBRC 104936]|uniref:DUF4424 domain-containing protein n=1 Tax=Sphingomonas changbaiensis NBRC 104936 TaxID=1219043 RepID=A0A0E9MRN0_9SPHN|nr:hypothetical protein [Sphingomonas changbaiensis]GAO39800.1 hypothetical protein SCH01S_39_00850 [Sphingomonas changbaiensis NBRC 104936]
MGRIGWTGISAVVLAMAFPAQAQAPQVESDGYTRYELLAPGSHKFRILYEITASTPGATAYFNPIRPGSTATDERVTDRATGQPLKFGVVPGSVAKAEGVRSAGPDGEYIRVELARPVPADGGEGRVFIDKTYEDAKSYYQDGNTIVFDRPLGVKRNAVVLPAGYELVSCNYPAQVLQEADGRIKIAFWNNTPAQAPLVIKARPSPGLAAAPSSMAKALDERAHQNREIVYFLNPPETHSFDLYHDYTESRPGVGTYVNIVRTGSAASKPSARNLDTGQPLKWELMKGADILKADPAEKGVTAETEAVVFHFDPVKPGGSARLRFSETYTDPDRYKLVGDELVWHRSFGRPLNTVVLPAGWVLTNSSIPGTVTQTDDGRTRIEFINPRTDEIDVVLTARRRQS